MSDTATIEFSAETKDLGDKIAELTLKDAKALSEYGIPANTVHYKEMEDYLKQMVEVQRGNSIH